MLTNARRVLPAMIAAAVCALAGCGHDTGMGQLFQVRFGGGGSAPDEGPSCMRESPAPIATEALHDAAVVVFVRPSFLGTAVSTTIVDRDGKFIGRNLSSSHFAVTLPPGEYVFVAWTHDAAALRATLAPGKRYYVEVGFDPGFGAFHTHFTAVKPGTDAWKKLPEWLADTRALVRDEAEKGRCIRLGEDVDERLKGAIKVLEKLGGDDLAEHTLRPEDGR